MELQIEEFDKKIRDIIPADTKLEHVATGFTFTEGPVWCGDYLLFSDIPRNRIVKLERKSHGPEVSTFRTPSGNSNGLTLDRSGRLVACEHSGRRVSLTEVDGTVSTLADSYRGNRLNSPNDVVVRSDGSVYFTDPSFGLGNPPKWMELSAKGVYRVSPAGEIELVAADFNMPNGLAFSPDESVLYVDDTFEKHIRAFDVAADGSLSKGRVFVKMDKPEGGAPDGMKVDVAGNVYCTGSGGFWVISPDGQPLGRVMMDELPANMAWGDRDWKSLYLTARSSIYRLKLPIAGISLVSTGL